MLQGIDSSHYQGSLDYPALKAQGVAFAGVQLTVGVNDDAFGQRNVKAALAAKLYALPYHFANASASGAAQADHFAAVLKTLPTANVLPVLDIEGKEGATAQHVFDFLTRWGNRQIAIYSGPGAYARVMGGRNVDIAKRYGLSILWNADYRGPRPVDANDPRFRVHFVANAYGYGGFQAAQIVQYGPFHGIDGDVFAGTADDLAALFGATPAPKVTYRYGGIPAWRGDYIAVTNALVRSGPGMGAPRVTTYSPGHVFHVAQSLRRSNGRLWLGLADGGHWVLADGRVKVKR